MLGAELEIELRVCATITDRANADALGVGVLSTHVSLHQRQRLFPQPAAVERFVKAKYHCRMTMRAERTSGLGRRGTLADAHVSYRTRIHPAVHTVERIQQGRMGRVQVDLTDRVACCSPVDRGVAFGVKFLHARMSVRARSVATTARSASIGVRDG